MKDAAEAIDRLLSHLGTLLRYVAPGFAALYVVAAVIPNSRSSLSCGSPAVVVLGMLLGSIIYGVHTSALERLLWLPIMWARKKTCKMIWAEMSKLDDQRWLRRASEAAQVRSIQAEMDKWGAMQNFLYCLSYTMILVPLTAWIYSVASSEWFAVLLGGCFVLVVVLASEYRMTGKEIELAKRYPDGKGPDMAMDRSGNSDPVSG